MADDVTSAVVPSVIEPLSVRVKTITAIFLLVVGVLVATVFSSARKIPVTNTSFLLSHLRRGPYSDLEVEILNPRVLEPKISEPVYHGETTPDTMMSADVSERVAQQYSLAGSSPNPTPRPTDVTIRKELTTSLTMADYPTELPGLLAKEMETTRRKFLPVEPTELERNSTVFPESLFPESTTLTEQKSTTGSPKTDTAQVATTTEKDKATAMKLADDDRYGKLVPIRQWHGAPVVDSSDLIPVRLFSSLNTEPLVPIGNK